MLLAVAGMMTSCGGDLCTCLKDAGDDEEKGKACFDDGTSDEDMVKQAVDCAKKDAEGEGEGEGEG